MDNEIKALTDAIKDDYRKWHGNITDPVRKANIAKMEERFDNGLVVKTGRKYIKIIIGQSVWGFIVNIDNDAKFKRGDILMPAGYSTPARNFARGNIYNGYEPRWVGAA